MTGTNKDSERLTRVSNWMDSALYHKGSEAVDLHRTLKLVEEAGEVVSALIGVTGANPRKGFTHTKQDVVEELLDVALSALAAVEHFTGNSGVTFALLSDKLQRVAQRAGVDLE